QDVRGPPADVPARQPPAVARPGSRGSSLGRSDVRGILRVPRGEPGRRVNHSTFDADMRAYLKKGVTIVRFAGVNPDAESCCEIGSIDASCRARGIFRVGQCLTRPLLPTHAGRAR